VQGDERPIDRQRGCHRGKTLTNETEASGGREKQREKKVKRKSEGIVGHRLVGCLEERVRSLLPPRPGSDGCDRSTRRVAGAAAGGLSQGGRYAAHQWRAAARPDL